MADLTGYKWIRELFPNVKWDAATKTATVPGGPSFNASQGIIQNGKFYLPTSTMGQGFMNWEPEDNFTPEKIQSTAETLRSSLFDPFWQAYQETSSQRANAIEARADEQRRMAEAAYSSGLANWNSQKENSLTKAMEQARNTAIARGVYDSGVYDNLRQRNTESVENAYAPGLQSLETTRAANLANIGSESGQALDELALADKQYEAQLQGNLITKSLEYLQNQQTEQKTKAQQMAEWLFGLGEQNYNQAQDLQAATGYYTDPTTGEQKPTMDRYFKEQELALSKQAAARAGSGSGGGTSLGTQTDRKNYATTTLLNAGLQRYDQLRKSGNYKYPLYYTVSSMLRDPHISGAAIESGADVIKAVDALIMAKAKQSPEQYFSSGTGAKLKDFYYALKGKTATASNDDLESLLYQQLH